MSPSSTVRRRATKAHQALQNVRDTLRFVWRSSPGFTVTRACLLIAHGFLPLAGLYIMKMVVDAVAEVVKNPDAAIDFTYIASLIALEGAVAIALVIVQAVAQWVASVHDDAIAMHMSGVILKKSVEADLQYYEDASFYDMFHLTQRQAHARVGQTFRDVLTVGQSVVCLGAMVVLLVVLHWAVALVLFATVIPRVLIRLRYSRRMFSWEKSRAAMERKTQYYYTILTKDAFAKEVRTFHLGRLFQGLFHRARVQLRDERLRIFRRRSVSEGVSQVVATAAIYFTYAFIAYRTIHGDITLGSLLLYYQAFQRGRRYLHEMLRGLADVYADQLHMSTLFTFLGLESKVAEPAEPKLVPEPFREGIAFRDVSFRYPTEESRIALESVDLEIRPGETIALVGENGSGKTTLVKLLCRLYDPTEGAITLDGIDLRDFATVDLRRQFGVIFQDFARYNLSVKDNIRLGDADAEANMARIREAARESGIDDVIQRLPHGYDTTLGMRFENGAELSIGEWQKVALARAFFRDAQVVVLDEPTSAMDPSAEYEVFRRFRELVRDKAAVLVSHRFSTVRMADRIYVLERGRVVESGPHDELMAREGRYARLFQTQAQYYT